MDRTEKYRKRIFTLPNLLSLFRLALIPIIIYAYVVRRDHLQTLFLLTLSGVTDVADGIIARKWNMVSDFGKAFDPVADKLTQMAVLFCLISRFPYMLLPLALMVVKESASAVIALLSIRHTGVVKGAAWHGKLTTVLLYFSMALHVIWYDLPRAVSLTLVGICMSMMLVSFVLYTLQHVKLLRTPPLKTIND